MNFLESGLKRSSSNMTEYRLMEHYEDVVTCFNKEVRKAKSSLDAVLSENRGCTSLNQKCEDHRETIKAE
jgi:hypothetical protein